jgi:hypothetical protein
MRCQRSGSGTAAGTGRRRTTAERIAAQRIATTNVASEIMSASSTPKRGQQNCWADERQLPSPVRADHWPGGPEREPAGARTSQPHALRAAVAPAAGRTPPLSVERHQPPHPWSPRSSGRLRGWAGSALLTALAILPPRGRASRTAPCCEASRGRAPLRARCVSRFGRLRCAAQDHPALQVHHG